MYYLIIAIIVAADQLAKHFISGSMSLGESQPLIGDLLYLTYVQNTGGAFSILSGYTAVLILIPAVFLTGIAIFLFRKRKIAHWTLLLSLSLICGGGLGNFIDRARLGYVVDFFDVKFWPVFNIADICVCCGCGLLVLYMLFFEKKSISPGVKE